MRISVLEQAAIRDVIALGKLHGFGNLISHLRTAWAKQMMEQYGMDEKQARESAHSGTPYPFLMQEDLIQRGEWDETGERYRQ